MNLYKKSISYIYYNLKHRIQTLTNVNNRKKYAGHYLLDKENYNHLLYEFIVSGRPFMVARYGTVELNCCKAFEFGLKHTYTGNMACMAKQAGFFPIIPEAGLHFTELMKEASLSVDILGTQFIRMEEYFIRHFMNKDVLLINQRELEPFIYPLHPWTSALEGKKVLIIHPFTATIQEQYTKRKDLFPTINILPEFQLKTIKAVNTLQGKSEEYDTWFDALKSMYQQAIDTDFDIAILGCGAYGFPLAAMLKKAGKQAIHLGGATQALFGIRCKRFDEAPDYGYIRKYYNEAWSYAKPEETPIGASKVEG